LQRREVKPPRPPYDQLAVYLGPARLVGISKARRMTRARTPAESRADRFGREAWPSAGRRVGGASAGIVGGVASIPWRRWTGSSRARAAITPRSVQLILPVWRASLQHGQLVAQDEDLDLHAGVGSGAQHEPAQEAWRTSGRSASAPRADHAGTASRGFGRSTGVSRAGTHIRGFHASGQRCRR
jgi:hypothetical protein